ncbi:MAG: hypothetical protein Q4P78_02605 [Rothia sp. (in: high G+C Gram-positive bacteria)]|uniref:hypothetical protein n=1 Tax=Rothia sp. (in: high G+C Gram-positive bacteria) TaxID=1885016 RepID=UPI0026DFB4FC|nr:hypothetical protein [Rothia sp. (in: high G+C Gram-positive bacteria)]MDO5750079.1 hypothetical protein [Rothia sp. (in: high G+C Gram-positive bacteria)]
MTRTEPRDTGDNLDALARCDNNSAPEPAARAYAQVLGVWLATRLLGFAMFVFIWTRQDMGRYQRTLEGLGRDSSMYDSSLWSYLNWWDSYWYYRLAQEGYPSVLPDNVLYANSVGESTWAFMPVFPSIVSWLSSVTGMSYFPVAVICSLIFSALMACAMYKVFRLSLNASAQRGYLNLGERSTHRIALITVLLYGLYAASPIFNTGYSEALTVLLIVLVAWCLMAERYMLLLPVALLASLTRPVGVPIGAWVGIWWVVCTINDMHTDERGMSISSFGASLKQRWGQLASALLVCSFAFIHPLHAALKTGRTDAYLATELAWSGRNVADGHHYIVQWGQGLHKSIARPLPETLYLAAALLVFALFFWWLSRRAVRAKLHPVLLIWCWCYAAYLLIFWYPQSSTIRILLPLFPLALLFALAVRKSHLLLWGTIALGVVSQAVWLYCLWYAAPAFLRLFPGASIAP